jgi:multicomponent Na+:H+ antiporter subunit E
MKHFFTHLFLTMIWIALTMKLTLDNFIFGFIVSFFVLWFVQRNNSELRYFKILPRFLDFTLLFVKEIIVGSLKIGYDIVTPRHYMNPGIIAVPLDAKTDLEITLLANSITLTPGTTSLAVSDDKTVLYVYCVYIDKEDKQKSIDGIKNGLEKKLLNLMR